MNLKLLLTILLISTCSINYSQDQQRHLSVGVSSGFSWFNMNKFNESMEGLYYLYDLSSKNGQIKFRTYQSNGLDVNLRFLDQFEAGLNLQYSGANEYLDKEVEYGNNSTTMYHLRIRSDVVTSGLRLTWLPQKTIITDRLQPAIGGSFGWSFSKILFESYYEEIFGYATYLMRTNDPYYSGFIKLDYAFLRKVADVSVGFELGYQYLKTKAPKTWSGDELKDSDGNNIPLELTGLYTLLRLSVKV